MTVAFDGIAAQNQLQRSEPTYKSLPPRANSTLKPLPGIG